MKDFDIKKYLIEGKLLKEDEGISPSNYGEGYFDTTTQYMQPGDFFVRTGSGEEIEISSIEPPRVWNGPSRVTYVNGKTETLSPLSTYTIRRK